MIVIYILFGMGFAFARLFFQDDVRKELRRQEPGFYYFVALIVVFDIFMLCWPYTVLALTIDAYKKNRAAAK